MTYVSELAEDAVDQYADTLSEVAAALAVADVGAARGKLAPIAGELWAGRLSLRTDCRLRGPWCVLTWHFRPGPSPTVPQRPPTLHLLRRQGDTPLRAGGDK